MRTRIGAAILLAAMSLPAMAAPRGCPNWERIRVPVQQAWPGSLESHLTQIASLPDATDVLVLGDSHAAIWPADFWQPLRALNGGNPGDWIENLLWRLQAPEWRKLRPQNVVVTVGTNNLARGDCTFAIIEGIDTVLRRVRELWPHARVLHIGIPMRGPQGSLRRTERMAVNAILRRGTLASFIDPDPILNCADCFDSAEIVHPSREGYVALTAAVRPLLRPR